MDLNCSLYIKMMYQYIYIYIYERRHVNIDGFVQDCSISIVNALEFLQSRTKPSICWLVVVTAIIILTHKQGFFFFFKMQSYFPMLFTPCIKVTFWYETGPIQWISVLWMLMAWCCSTRASVTAVLSKHTEFQHHNGRSVGINIYVRMSGVSLLLCYLIGLVTLVVKLETNILAPYHPIQVIAINTLRPGQNGHRFADNISKCIFLNENVCILIKMSLKFFLKDVVDNSHG